VPANRAKIVLGTRGSQLARVQTELVIERLKHSKPNLEIESKIITTHGDERMTDPRAGRKGLFTGELERALLSAEIDVAVHSAKDLPSNLAARTKIAAVLKRGSTDDVLILKAAGDLQSLKQNAVVATGSVRRQHQLRWNRPDIHLVEVRGNVPTRLRKLVENKWDGIILARAGLERLHLQFDNGAFDFEKNALFAHILPQEIFLPAGGQGVIAIQSRCDDGDMKSVLGKIDDEETHTCLRAEREFLRLLNADCNQPIGVAATITDGKMRVRAQIFDDKSVDPRVAMVDGTSGEPEKLAARLFNEIV
jgi:hydroxymethylbilane synthase